MSQVTRCIILWTYFCQKIALQRALKAKLVSLCTINYDKCTELNNICQFMYRVDGGSKFFFNVDVGLQDYTAHISKDGSIF